MSEFGGALDNWLNRDNPYENEDECCEYCDEEDCVCPEPDYEAIVEADYDYRNS